MLAARYGRVEVLQEFKDYIMHNESASIKFLDNKNHNNKSALDLAYEGGFYECASLLTTLKAALTDKQRIVSQEDPIFKSDVSNLQSKCTTLANNSHNFVAQSSHSDVVMIKHAKSHDKLTRNNGKNIKNIKLPPINGKRFVGYSEWTQNYKVNSDRNTL
jgi:hypothetical protein